ncbi:hypothetical protein tloyanaT_11680 [Thalassotalea loyana]|uniref:MSHA biogenesis protein MshK n=1 Tax=Thalassotalea loyana TaxID=280483 RepID=A0ABQ6HDC9_9GAMM|nr:hypothetical protein [Thalassotalea loyana]GLX84916.1 hypothetical protein tloyanaT_11680 [Thalassotalea loyana]
MNTLLKTIFVGVIVTSFNAFSEPSSEHASQASKHSALAIGHGSIASTQVASAVVAVPLIVGGSVAVSAGQASVEVGDGLSKVVTSKTVKKQKPVELEVTEVTITIDRSPAEAMKKEQ